jgi:hypothetical protein
MSEPQENAFFLAVVFTGALAFVLSVAVLLRRSLLRPGSRRRPSRLVEFVGAQGGLVVGLIALVSATVGVGMYSKTLRLVDLPGAGSVLQLINGACVYGIPLAAPAAAIGGWLVGESTRSSTGRWRAARLLTSIVGAYLGVVAFGAVAHFLPDGIAVTWFLPVYFIFVGLGSVVGFHALKAPDGSRLVA